MRRIPVASPLVASTSPRSTTSSAPTLAQRVAALAEADGSSTTTAEGFDLVRRVPVAAPAAVIIGSGRDPVAVDTRIPPRTSASPLALPSPAVARARAGSPMTAATSAPLVRRAVHLPNARTTTASVAADRVRADAPKRIRNPLAERVAALAAADARPSVRDLPVGAPVAVVRRSMAVPTAPTRHAVVAATQVLPGIRSTTRAVGAATRQVRATDNTASSSGGSTADRLRELVSSGAFERGAPVRRLPVAPPLGTPSASASPDRLSEPASRHRSSPTATPATAAQRFEDVIRRTPAARQDKPQPLPARFRPLAERIVGPRVAVKVVHGAVTRAALEAAGHDAATSNSTIHLPSRPDASARTMSIVAHELEHVAVPSAAVRFHGGVDSPEERQATRTEQVVRRIAADINRRGGPEASAGTAGLPVAGLPAFGRSGSAAADAAPSAGGPPVPASAIQRQATSAAARAGRNTAASSGTADDTIRRAAPAAPPAGAGAAAAIAGAAGATSSGSSDSDGSAALSAAQLNAIIRAVEDRLLEEIERRGGLGRGAF